MITQLNATAAEMIATLNLDPATHNPALPLRDSALIPAELQPDTDYRYNGRHIYEMHGRDWMSRSTSSCPVRLGALLKLRERQYPNGRLERDVLRQRWLGETSVQQGKPTFLKDALFSVKIQQLELRRLASLTPEDLTRLGLRVTSSGFTFRNDDLSFATPQAATVAHWGGRFTRRFPFVTDNPHMWLIRWDEPVPHLTDEQRDQAFAEGVANLDRIDRVLEQAERELRVLKNERDAQNERLARQMQLMNAGTEDALLFIRGTSSYRVDRYGARKLRTSPA